MEFKFEKPSFEQRADAFVDEINVLGEVRGLNIRAQNNTSNAIQNLEQYLDINRSDDFRDEELKNRLEADIKAESLRRDVESAYQNEVIIDLIAIPLSQVDEVKGMIDHFMRFYEGVERPPTYMEALTKKLAGDEWDKHLASQGIKSWTEHIIFK